jgi:hypothetical protein
VQTYKQVCNRVGYHDDFRIPGMSPSLAASLKQARHMPKSRIKARLRPQRKQRRTTLDLNLGGRFDLATVDFFAMYMIPLVSPPEGPYRKKEPRMG